MRAPRFGALENRPKRWGRGLIVHAMQEFERREGRRLRASDLTHLPAGHLPSGIPSLDVIRRHFGSFRKACEAAYGSSLAPGGRHATKDADSERVIAELASGKTLTELAAQRGISGQGLGRRLRRYERANGLPVTLRKPGRPRKAA